jgi:hypothetical protein
VGGGWWMVGGFSKSSRQTSPHFSLLSLLANQYAAWRLVWPNKHARNNQGRGYTRDKEKHHVHLSCWLISVEAAETLGLLALLGPFETDDDDESPAGQMIRSHTLCIYTTTHHYGLLRHWRFIPPLRGRSRERSICFPRIVKIRKENNNTPKKDPSN